VAVQAQIAHAQNRAKDAENVAERVEKDFERQTSSLSELKEAADELQERMNEAAGELLIVNTSNDREAPTEEHDAGKSSLQSGARRIPDSVSDPSSGNKS